MQKHFLRGTRQDPVHPARAFSLEEFEYIHAKFFGTWATSSACCSGASVLT